MPPRKLLTALLSLPLGTGLATYTYAYTSPARHATPSKQPSRAHQNSPTMALANPRGMPVYGDSYTIRIPLRDLKPGISDEEILARFSKGFFGVWVFAPERWALRVTGLAMTDFPAFRDEDLASTLPTPVWSLSRFDTTTLFPVGTLVFGNSQLLDSSVANPDVRRRLYPTHIESTIATKQNQAFVEYVGGSDKSHMVFSDRVEVERDWDAVMITLSGFTCDPLTGEPAVPRVVRELLHPVFAKMLLGDGIREILRRG
ncbi:hypothetical protein IFM51744_10020 [Aspergillus udagawae]|nr:hypothetical protein IFM51744_10020 [Aspergillus udagawae]